MLLLENPIRDYAWGATDGVANLVGAKPSGGPEAELWVGTHPAAPSVVAVGEHAGTTLGEVIAGDPERWLGAELAAGGHTALPFLLKVLAIGRPLSLQAHPSAEQAQAGFAREEAAGLPVDAVERNYKDASPKPEALVALTPTWALCGFRTPIEAANLFAGLGIAAFDPLVEALATGGDDGLRTVLGWLLRLDGSERRSVADEVAAAVDGVRGDDLGDPRTWVRRLVRTFPGDPTAVAPLLLNVLHLDVGDAVHLPAGNLHAYLDGAGIEIMAASDNVLRGGLTPKHIDVDELLAVLRFEPGVPAAPASTGLPGGITTYDAGEEAFAVALVDAGAGAIEVTPTAPTLVLATGGAVTLTDADESVAIDHGGAAFLPPSAEPVAVSGPGRAWWATTGAGLPR
jgi:mannose-6-phosphate isomerase